MRADHIDAESRELEPGAGTSSLSTTPTSSVPLRVLILEDRRDDAALMVLELKRLGFDTAWQLAQTESEYLAALEPSLGVILADYSLPALNGIQALKRNPDSK